MTKTRFEVLKEVLPNIAIGYDGYPWNCIYNYDQAMYSKDHCDREEECTNCKKRFWDEEIKLPARDVTDTEKILSALSEMSSKVEQLETLIKINYPTNVTGAPSNRIPEVNVTLLRAIHTGEEAIISKEDSNAKMD
nr:MAG TPA: hypothetical protein [Caudoviricetes sp.]